MIFTRAIATPIGKPTKRVELSIIEVIVKRADWRVADAAYALKVERAALLEKEPTQEERMATMKARIDELESEAAE